MAYTHHARKWLLSQSAIIHDENYAYDWKFRMCIINGTIYDLQLEKVGQMSEQQNFGHFV